MSSVAECDIFEFMANHLGLTVIHPGGLRSTQKLEDNLEINSKTRVLDIACGKGSAAFYLAEKYGCSVVGIDISPELIEEAKDTCKKKKLDEKVEFIIGDATDLPFADNQFDIAISQGILVFVDDKVKTINEASRVIKEGGKAGWIELSWKEEPNKEFTDNVFNILRGSHCKNAKTYEGWAKIFKKAEVNDLKVLKGDNLTGNFSDTLKEEGIINTLRIMFRSVFNKEIRNRMKKLGEFVEANQNYFGYGIYVIEKT